MEPVEVYVGFHKPWLRNKDGWSISGLFGHCEVWFYTNEQTWVFIDPLGHGTTISVTHLHDDVEALLAARFATCSSILRLTWTPPKFRVPIFGMMTCASICGAVVGVRALVPSTLRRRLLRKGAETIHEAEGRPEGQGGEAEGAEAL